MLANQNYTKKGDNKYGDRYATIYNDKWWAHEHWKPVADFYEQVLRDALQSSKNWLDVGCGTGYFLSKFQECERSGLDRSPNMLARAQQANPGATFYQQSMTDQNAELEDKFDLVSCTGQPFCYLPSMHDIETSMNRLAEWTAPGGTCVLAPCDLVDVWDTEFPSGMYDMSGMPLSTTGVEILGLVWTYREHDDSYYSLLCPQLHQFVRWFAVHFRKVEIVVRAESAPGTSTVMRRMVVASERREIGDNTPVTVIAPPESDLYKVRSKGVKPLAQVSNKMLLRELVSRLRSGQLVKSAFRKISS